MTNIIRSRLRKILLPYGLIDLANVIFQRQWQKVRWLNTETSIQRFTVLMWIGLPTITFVLWLITNQSIGSIRSAVNGLNALVLISLIPMILSSLYSIALVIGTINSLYTSKQWEILRLTSQNQNAILMGYDAFFQLRLWPLVISEMGLRLSIFVIFLINHISETRDYSASTNVSFFASIPFATWLIFPVVAFFFFIEPIARTRLLIAIQMVIAFRVTRIMLAIFLGVVALLITNLIHLILFDGSWAVFIAIAVNDAGSGIALFCLVPIAVLGAALAFLFYISLRGTALSMAYKSAFHQD